jgi:tRNA pseudouridine65 synthase
MDAVSIAPSSKKGVGAIGSTPRTSEVSNMRGRVAWLAVRLPILHIDAAVVAIDKPPGLLVHPSALDAHESVTALGVLQSQLGEKLYPLHRLDKATSGILLFGRTAEAAREWRERFDRGEVRKRYIALVRGWPPEEGTIAYALARDPEFPSAGQDRLDALTHYRLLDRYEWPVAGSGYASTRCALVEVRPVTGRRHQIRRHFKHIAHPLIGDSTHGKGPLNRALAAFLGTARLWLHAAEVEAAGLRVVSPLGPEWDWRHGV